eukprot:CAMPEP_0117697634 /NCGR_PEP_ID=MMETSP0804-20121206/29346_1 /TAXON_ID=1074897 /ORGANISM="Tetraselmis astigmatica, Strain CCMP880" /LENGTH=1323 /DNA_ID=CAMNT_0005511923 /DNA_START=85 /DNA_END=4056 /DNA_ORIENTATION=+
MAAGQGLVGLLQRRSQPSICCFSSSAAPVATDVDDGQLLLVDGQAVLKMVAEELHKSPDLMPVYMHTGRFMVGLKRTGMKVLVVLPEELASDLGSAGNNSAPPEQRAALPFYQALCDYGAELLWGKGSQLPLLLSLYRKKKAQISAVVTDDVCFFVYGVEKFGFVKDVLVDANSTTLVLWDCEDCWKKWRLGVGGRLGGLSALERAQVAVLLGATPPSDASQQVQGGVEALSLSSSAPRVELLCSPTVAATMALAFDASEELPLKFFQEVLGLVRFGEKDLKAFRTSVEQLMLLVSKTKSGSPGEEQLQEAPPSAAAAKGLWAEKGGEYTPTPKELLDFVEEEESMQEAAAAKAAAASGVKVEVGSSLTSSEWNEIDDKDLISKTRHGTGYRIMLKIPAYDPEPRLPPAPSARLDEDSVWQYMYARRKEEKVWRRVAEATFPVRWAAAHDKDSLDKKTSSELKKLTEASVMERVEALRDSGLSQRTKAYLKLLPGSDADSILALRREAIIQGADSVAWKAAEACWNYASSRVKAAVLFAMFTCDNKAAVSGPPARYPHQEELLAMMHSHLARNQSDKIDHSLPLQIELSTPTGSGKTFAALMVHLQLLKPHHPDGILVYSVPTKTVLKTVGQSFEAHGVVYWTAAFDGNKYQVRRPYSIRTTRTKGDAGSTGMAEQLEKNRVEGKENRDRGGGKPDVIIADIQATAALMEAACEADPKSFYHSANVVLYFDEPNMGVHLSPKVKETVSRILSYSPFTMVLASATLPPWSALPSWWRVHGQPATRATITLEPYELPQAHLEVLDELRQELRTVNLLALFESHEQFCALLRDNKRLRIIMLRHLTPQQGLDLLGADPTSENTGFGLVHGEVATLREALEANLTSLMSDKERFEELRAKWSKEDSVKGVTASGGPVISGVISKTGITLIATQEPRKLALEIAGRHNEKAWSERIHRLNAEISHTAKLHKDSEKEKARKKKYDAQDDDATTGFVRLREGIHVSLADAEGADQQELLMLSSGVAYSSGDGASSLVQGLYQQTLLSVPEKVVAQSRKLPPINVLVVDYSAIYGTDCPAVDTLIMVNELGKALTWQDHQQFMGRLRRDGRAIYSSLDTLRQAATGAGGPAASGTGPNILSAASTSLLLLQAAAQGLPSSKVAADLDKRREDAGMQKRELAANIATAMLGQLLGPPPDSKLSDSKAYGAPTTATSAPAAMKEAVDKWGPLVRHFARGDSDQVAVLAAVQQLAEGRGEWGEAGKLFTDVSARLLKLLYDEDVVSEEAIFEWEAKARKTTGDSRFLLLAAPLIKWLREAEDEDSEEEEDEEEE